MEMLDGFDATAIDRAASLLKSGQVVAFPTETVYGLGADAFNPVAVAKIFELKKRPHFDPLIVHVSDADWVERLALSVPPQARALMKRFWPGPLSIIFQKKDVVPDIVTSGLSTVAIRMPAHEVALALIGSLGSPVAAPSANPFGYMSTTRARDVERLFGSAVPLILDGGPCIRGIESTIVSIRGETVCIHRNGAITREEVEAVAGPVVERNVPRQEEEPSGRDPLCESPGELPYHYAPHSPLKIVWGPADIQKEHSGFLAFRPPVVPVRSAHMRVLTEKGDLREAAANFFSFLIELDRTKPEVIYAERIPEEGLGKAIMERLKKAANKCVYKDR
jgi:L-threonylcarbamoyladenylate synthase